MRPLHPRARTSTAFERRGGGVPRRAADDRRRQRHRRARARARRARASAPATRSICPAFTFFATAEAIARRGATPVFADIDPATLNLDPADVARAITPRTKAIMPVHLFGRPAPLDELRGARAAARRGRRAGVRLAGDRDARRRLDVQLLPDEEPLRARRRRAGRGQRRRARRADPDAPLPRLAGQEALRVRRLQLAPRRDPGGGAADLPAAARRLDAPAPRGGRALRRARPRRALRAAADEPGHVYHLFVVPLARARPDPRRARARRASATRSTTCRRCTCSRRSRYLGYREGDLPETERPRARTSRCRSGRGSRPSSRSGSSTPSARAVGTVAPARDPVTRHRLWQLGGRRGADRARVVARLLLRFDQLDVPVFYRDYLGARRSCSSSRSSSPSSSRFGFYNRWWRYVSTRDMWGAARGVIVGVASPSTSSSTFVPMHDLRAAARGRVARPAAAARASSPGSRLLARTLIERPQPGRSSRAGRR